MLLFFCLKTRIFLFYNCFGPMFVFVLYCVDRRIMIVTWKTWNLYASFLVFYWLNSESPWSSRSFCSSAWSPPGPPPACRSFSEILYIGMFTWCGYKHHVGILYVIKFYAKLYSWIMMYKRLHPWLTDWVSGWMKTRLT